MSSLPVGSNRLRGLPATYPLASAASLPVSAHREGSQNSLSGIFQGDPAMGDLKRAMMHGALDGLDVYDGANHRNLGASRPRAQTTAQGTHSQALGRLAAFFPTHGGRCACEAPTNSETDTATVIVGGLMGRDIFLVET